MLLVYFDKILIYHLGSSARSVNKYCTQYKQMIPIDLHSSLNYLIEDTNKFKSNALQILKKLLTSKFSVRILIFKFIKIRFNQKLYYNFWDFEYFRNLRFSREKLRCSVKFCFFFFFIISIKMHTIQTSYLSKYNN